MKRLLVISNEPYQAKFGSTNRQRLSRAAAANGWSVEFLETIGWAAKVRARPKDDEPVSVLPSSNVLPLSAKSWNRVGRAINMSIARWRLRDRAYDLVIVYDPFWGKFSKRVRASRVIYDCVDAYEFQPQYTSASSRAALWRAERWLSHNADLCVATSPTLAELKTEQWGIPVQTLIGAYEPPPIPKSDNTRLANGVSQASSKFRTSIVISALDGYKFDARPILSWLELAPENFVSIYGGVVGALNEATQTLLDHPRSAYHGVLAPQEVSRVASQHTFGWISLADTEYSKYSFPLKVWDYLSAGLAVVAFRAPSLSGISGVLHLPDASAIANVDLALRRSPTSASRPEVFTASDRWKILST